MKVERLECKFFRASKELLLLPGSGANIIYGDNAQGKTNLLEAIWLFSGQKSFRGSKDSEYIMFSQDYASLNLSFHSQNRQQNASIVFSAQDNKKQAKLNDIELKRISELSNSFCAVSFFPDQLMLIKQGPDKRRKLIDDALCQIYPRYENILDSYEKILRQRSRLLKDAKDRPSILDTLEAWDVNLVKFGGYIIYTRNRYIKKLSTLATEYYKGISSNKEELSLEYNPCLLEDIDYTALDDKAYCQEILYKAIKASKKEDMRLFATNKGPHRDDIYIAVNGKSARGFASQGQQRSCVLSIKLAECEMLAQSIEEMPVVLLDDVMSELDKNRQNFLLNNLVGKQVFITCCHPSVFEDFKDGNIFKIENGSLVEDK